MKNLCAGFIMLFSAGQLFSQISKDLDHDGIKDSVDFDHVKDRIVCKLSSDHFKPVFSKEIEVDDDQSGLVETAGGFEFYFNFMRAGYANQFRYEPGEKKIRLIGMNRYKFGPANNDGSGKSSVNLLTGDYIGEWNYYDHCINKLIRLPVIRTRISFQKVFLDAFDEAITYAYASRCSQLYLIRKSKMKRKINCL